MIFNDQDIADGIKKNMKLSKKSPLKFRSSEAP